jgi:hypothetical protein
VVGHTDRETGEDASINCHFLGREASKRFGLLLLWICNDIYPFTLLGDCLAFSIRVFKVSGKMDRKKSFSMRLETQFSQPPQTTAFQKLFMILGAGIFVALASLTASLPLPLPTHQDDPATFATSDGDTAWVIIATIFGILAAPAAAYLFGTCYSNILLLFSSSPLLL